MAIDWIKMRVDLQSHPKIVRILSATGSDKFRTIGGLHAVWSVFDAHSEDGKLKGYTPDLMDHIIGWPGFSRAMESVGWLFYDGLETLQMPEFDEHNGKSAKRRAEDQKRKRDERKLSEFCPQEDGQKVDELRTRKEKKRVNNKYDFLSSLLAAGVGKQEAIDYIAVRKSKKCTQTETAFNLLASEVEKSGMSWADVISTCIQKNWGGFEAEWMKSVKTAKKPSREMTLEDRRREAM